MAFLPTPDGFSGPAGRALDAFSASSLRAATNCREVQAAERLAFSFSLITLAYGFIGLATRSGVLYFFDFLISAVFAFIPLLAKKFSRRAAQVVLVLVSNGAVFVYSALYDPNIEIHLAFLALIGLPLVIFKKDHPIHLVIGALLPFALFYVVEVFGTSWLWSDSSKVSLPHWYRHSVVAVSFLVSFLVMYYFFSLHAKSEHSLLMALDRLEVSEDHLRATFSTAGLGIATISLSGKFMSVNPALCDILDYEEGMLIGRDKSDFIALNESKCDKLPLWASLLVSQSSSKMTEQRRFVKKDGGVVDVALTVSLHRTASGYPAYFVATFEDISQKLEADRLIKKHESAIVASAKMSALGEMAAGIAHEISNPLSVILGRMAQLLPLVESVSEVPEEVRTRLVSVDKAAVRILKLVKTLRSFARNAEKDPLTTEKLSVVLGDVMWLCNEKLDGTGVRLLTPTLREEVDIDCRPSEIGQILLNLISNSADAISALDEKWIEVSTEIQESTVRIIVTDSGSGIPSDVAQKMLLPFFSTKPVGKGTGIGLSISKTICEAHGGSLVYDPSHHHTRFIVTLPQSGCAVVQMDAPGMVSEAAA